MFKPITPNVNFPEMEEEILSYWKKNKIFEKSVESRSKEKKWTFLDGPPFITGMPHYGTLLSSIPKDVFPRYWTMKGYRVRRVWGWDCHGLPAENKVETTLGLASKREIEEKVGVGKFISECKRYVSDVSSEWEWYIDHIGRWVDFKNAYKTMDLSYMETVMWVFKQMYGKGYIYKGLRVSLYCPHCATPISNFEVAMDEENYKDMPDPASIYKYKLSEDIDTYILAWSTTPWNKIVTSALAVNPKLTYIKVKQNDKYYILAKSTLKMLKADPYKIIEEFKGEKLIGKKYEPHYNYYKIEKGKKAFIIIGGDFVTDDEGTGVVTIAAYGEEDLGAMQKENIHIEMHLDEEGTIKKSVPLFGGMYYLKANKYVEEDLKKRDLIYKEDSNYTHSVPLCWRCHTRLYYGPQDAWYVDIQKLKPLLFKTNKKVNWFSKHFKLGRFQKSVEHAPDWNISRSRYWGSPVPVWECGCGERFVPESISELEIASGQKIEDLHKPMIDEVTVVCKKCGQKAHRVPEVLDSWIEAGSASYAERHYPFDTKEKLGDFFPPDFIAEYTGQIRAWFYVVHVIGAALFETEAFKNVLVEGVILGSDGRKMSKNYGNYPDPKEMLQKYGGDALRLYLLGSPVMKGEDIRISEKEYRDQVRGMMLILWNVYNFLITYANVDKWNINVTLSTAKNPEQGSGGEGDPSVKPQDDKLHLLDQWIITLLDELTINVTKYLEAYDTVSSIRATSEFITNLSQWYVRRSRERVGPTALNITDKNNCYSTLYSVLTTLSKLMAPFAPFISEEIYRNLTGEESIHLAKWPEISGKRKGERGNLLEEMELVRKVCELGHAKRKEAGMKVRQPLGKFEIRNSKFEINKELLQLIKDELNVKEIEIVRGKGELSVELDTKLTAELIDEGEARGLVRQIQNLRKSLGCGLTDKIKITLPAWPKEFTDYIKKETLAIEIREGNSLKVESA